MKVQPAYWIVALACAVLLVIANSAHAAQDLQVSPAAGAPFPDRSMLVTLPARRALTAADVRVTESGRAVGGVRVTRAGDAAGQRFGVMLVIDTSSSMHGDAIAGAMDAARTFAARRPERQALGVMFFNGNTDLALAPTRARGRIDAALAPLPALDSGTHILDAADAAIGALRRARIGAGSVVLLSDGRDSGSSASLDAVARRARDAHVKLYTVGLRSRAYDGVILRALAAAGSGRYVEAQSADALASAFDDLAQRLANEYVVSYRSGARLGSDVHGEVQVSGVPGSAAFGYRAPAFPAVAKPAPAKRTWWTGADAMKVVGALVAALLGLALYLALRPRPVSVRERIKRFVTDTEPQRHDVQKTAAVLASAEKSLARSKWWPAFVEDVSVARLSAAPGKIVALTAGATLLLAWLLLTTGRGVIGIAAVVLVPWSVRAFVRRKANKNRQEFSDQLMDNLQVIVSAMRTGQSFAGALAVAVNDASEPARSELRRVVQDEQLGVPIEQAVYAVARRMRSSEFEHVGLAAALQRETGGNTAEVLDRLIDNIRARGDIRRLVRSLSAQGRMGGLIVSVIPVFVVVFLSATTPGYLQPMLDSGGGRVALVLAGCMLMTGWVAIRRIVDVKV